MDIREYYDPCHSDLNEAPDRRPGLPVADVAFPGPVLVELRRLRAAVRGLR